jgi:acyl-CoA synthetase (AMP-forming)/AMP-acid ligase II
MSRVLQNLRRFSTVPSYWPGNYASYMLQHIEAGARAAAARPALIDGVTGRVTSYGDLPYRFGAAARGFKALGIRRGTVVGLHLANSPEFIVAFNALAALGAVVTTSNPAYSPTELTHQLKDSGANFVLTMEPLLPVVTAAASGAGLPMSRVLVLGAPATAFLYEDVAAAGALRALPEVEAVDGPRTLLALPYSSGTTGLPKGVELSHGNLTANLEQSYPGLEMSPGDVAVGVLPLYHI